MMLDPQFVPVVIWLFTGVLCIPIALIGLFRRRLGLITGLAALNLVACMGFVAVLALRQEASARAEERFIAEDPGHPDARFPGGGLHIPDLQGFGFAAYRCALFVASGPECELPLLAWLASGKVDFVEIGTAPVQRYQLAVHEPRCFAPTVGARLGDLILSAPLGICAFPTEVDRTEAAYVFETETTIMPGSTGRRTTQAQLVARETGAVLARFDGWAVPWDDDGTPPARGPGPLISELLKMPGLAHFPYDQAKDLALMEAHGLDEAALLASLTSERQNVRARTVWFACADQVRARLSAGTLAALAEAAARDFPGYTLPDSCAARLR